MTGAEDLRLQRLCGHHDTRGFASGDRWLDQELGLFQERFELGEDIVVFVLADDDVVVAYIGISQCRFKSDETGGVLHYFVIPAVAVIPGVRGSTAFSRLRAAAEDAIEVRRRVAPDIDYRGIIALPKTNPRLPRVLGRMGFVPFEGNEELMWRPFAD